MEKVENGEQPSMGKELKNGCELPAKQAELSHETFLAINEIEAEKERRLIELLVKFIVRISLKEYYEKKSN